MIASAEALMPVEAIKKSFYAFGRATVSVDIKPRKSLWIAGVEEPFYRLIHISLFKIAHVI